MPSTIKVSSDVGFTLELSVTRLTPDTIQVVTSVESSHGSMDPTIFVRLGQPASVSVADLGLELTTRPSGGYRFLLADVAA